MVDILGVSVNRKKPGVEESSAPIDRKYEKVASNVHSNDVLDKRLRQAAKMIHFVHNRRIDIGQRLDMANLVIEIHAAPYAESFENPDLWEKLTAWAVLYQLGVKHLENRTRYIEEDFSDPWEQWNQTQQTVSFIQLQVLTFFDIVWHSCFKAKHVSDQFAVYLQELNTGGSSSSFPDIEATKKILDANMQNAGTGGSG